METVSTPPLEAAQNRLAGQYPASIPEMGAVAVSRLLTYEQLDSSFNTGKVVFVEGRTYYDGQLIDGVNTLF